MNADKYQTQNDAKSNKAHAAQKTNAFCQSRYTNQSLALATTYTHSNSINSIHFYPPTNPTYKFSIKSLTKNCLFQIILSIKKHHSQSITSPIIHYSLYAIPQFQNSQFSVQPHLQHLTLLFLKKYSSPLDEIQLPKHTSVLLSNAREHPTNLKWKKNTKTFTSSSTQTEGTSNKGMGRTPFKSDPNFSIYPLGNQANMPEYRKNLSQVFGEEFLAEATKKSKQLAPLIKLIEDRDWNTMKTINPYFYSFKRDLSVTPSGSILYDNRLMITKSLKQLVIDLIHKTHPRHVGILRLADLIWFPRIHRDVTYKAQSSSDCIKNGKNLKAIQTKSELGFLPKLNEHNEEIQMDFACPLSFRKHKDVLHTSNGWPLNTLSQRKSI